MLAALGRRLPDWCRRTTGFRNQTFANLIRFRDLQTSDYRGAIPSSTAVSSTKPCPKALVRVSARIVSVHPYNLGARED